MVIKCQKLMHNSVKKLSMHIEIKIVSQT